MHGRTVNDIQNIHTKFHILGLQLDLQILRHNILNRLDYNQSALIILLKLRLTDMLFKRISEAEGVKSDF